VDEIIIRRIVNASPEVAWPVFTEHDKFSEYTMIPTSRLVEAGAGDRYGTGAVRKLGLGPLGASERITEWNPPNSYRYVLFGTPLVKDHDGLVELKSVQGEPDLTSLTWTIHYRPALALFGGPAKQVISRAVTSIVGGLSAEAERRMGSA
jgi:hypothetical protein